MKVFISLLGLVLAGSLLAAAPLTTNELFEARVQGSNGLAAFKRRISPSNAARLGFASTNEAQLAVLGDSFVVYQVPRSHLVAFSLGQRFDTLLEPVPRVIFPAMVGTQAKSSVTVSLNAGVWRTERSGGPGFIKEMTTVRNAIASTNLALASQSFAVQVPVLSLWFLGYTNPANNRVEFLTTTELKIGVTTNASGRTVTPVLMKKLADIASHYGGSSN